MIGVLVVTHESLGEHLIRCAQHVLGEKPEKLQHLGVFVQDDPDMLLANAQTMIKQIDTGAGVLVLCDIFGATPCNISGRLMQSGKVECLSGVNLPMLVRTLSYRHEVLSVVLEKALDGGKSGIRYLNMEPGYAA